MNKRKNESVKRETKGEETIGKISWAYMLVSNYRLENVCVKIRTSNVSYVRNV